jgi:integrase/recombinase XerD
MKPSNALDAWDARPAEQFAAFVVSPEFALTSSRQSDLAPTAISPESAAIYRFMFGKFAAWMLERGLKMSTLTSSDLQRFILLSREGKRDLNSKIAYRYLRLLERCYVFLERDPNPAREAIIAADRAHLTQDAPMIALADDVLQRFLDALPSGARPDGDGSAGWKRRRDRAMQVTMAMAGLRVAEAIGLLLGEVGRQADVDGAIELNITPERKHPTSHEHTAVLPREGVLELDAWLRERQALDIPGELVFPANLEGEPLHKATVYRQVRATFERAGVAVPRLGGRTLRNTFASRQLQNGATPGELTTALGLALERSAAAYGQARIAHGDDTAQEAADDEPGGDPPRP